MPGPSPLFLFAPGAGAGIDSAWMQAWRARLGTIGIVEAFDYPYRLAGRSLPDRHDVLVAAHRAAWQGALARHGMSEAQGRRPVFFVGKSMGSRMGCHLAAEEPTAARALICFGYPLRGQTGKLRDQVLRELGRPVLFIQGTRDPHCPIDELTALLSQLPVKHELLIVEGGDHSLEVPRPRRPKGEAAPDPQAAADARILTALADFVARHV